MKVLLVARGSQGDVYPFLAMAKALRERGHGVSIHLPKTFEKFVKELESDLGIAYSLQDDDIEARANNDAKIKMSDMLSWMSETIESQFEELLPLVEKHDMFIVSNTEFSATTLSEYTGKPLLRAAYSPIIPSRKIMPPLSPLTKPIAFIRPSLLWFAVNAATEMIAKKPINKWRSEHGMKKLKNYCEYSYSSATNLLLYNKIIGTIDTTWKYPYHLASYCFYEAMHYDKNELYCFLSFVRRDSKPILFFTTGSIKGSAQNNFAKELYSICKKHSYKFVLGAGWGKLEVEDAGDGEDLFVLNTVIPHALVFEHCTAIIHHGGSGTTHSATRSGKPQLIAPLIIDQFYWADRIHSLALGPAKINLKKTGGKKLESTVLDLMTNTQYAKNAAMAGKKFRDANNIEETIEFIEKFTGA